MNNYRVKGNLYRKYFAIHFLVHPFKPVFPFHGPAYPFLLISHQTAGHQADVFEGEGGRVAGKQGCFIFTLQHFTAAWLQSIIPSSPNNRCASVWILENNAKLLFGYFPFCDIMVNAVQFWCLSVLKCAPGLLPLSKYPFPLRLCMVFPDLLMCRSQWRCANWGPEQQAALSGLKSDTVFSKFRWFRRIKIKYPVNFFRPFRIHRYQVTFPGSILAILPVSVKSSCVCLCLDISIKTPFQAMVPASVLTGFDDVLIHFFCPMPVRIILPTAIQVKSAADCWSDCQESFHCRPELLYWGTIQYRRKLKPVLTQTP